MKAPRKTPKRPIYRYTERIDDDVKIKIKDDENNVKLVMPEKKKIEIDDFDNPVIEFGNVSELPLFEDDVTNLFEDMEVVISISLSDVINVDADFKHMVDLAFEDFT